MRGGHEGLMWERKKVGECGVTRALVCCEGNVFVGGCASLWKGCV